MLRSSYQDGWTEAGCDEAGRGCLAGPVFAAAVILPAGYTHPILNDSKKLSAAQRYRLRDDIIRSAVSWAYASVDNQTIDQVNILKASIMAMHLAVDQLQPVPGFLIIDGNRFYPYRNIPHRCIIRGDGLYFSIAAASVLAKTFRDDYMNSLHQKYPEYRWNKNKGYPTADHRKAIQVHGITPFHRKTFIHPERQLSLSL